MEPASTKITEAARSVQRLQIDGYSATATMEESDYIKSRWNVYGYDWEVHLYPTNQKRFDRPSVALDLFFLSNPRTSSKVRVNFSFHLVDPSRKLKPSEKKSHSHEFSGSQRCTYGLFLKERRVIEALGYVKNDCLTVEGTITVLKDLPEIFIPQVIKKDVPLPLPSSNLHQHLGELLENQKGADVTFELESGERFPAHKNILAARSPVFMAEFFGHMEKSSSQLVVVRDMEPAVFKAMLRFIYTDTAPELDGALETAVTMAQHLLAAADRYGLERLKVICEAKLSGGIDIETAATTLPLAEQHNCSLLKAKCVEFITGSPEKLDAVLATEGYTHLAASCPLVFACPTQGCARNEELRSTDRYR